MLPESTFYQYAKKYGFAVADNMLYTIKKEEIKQRAGYCELTGEPIELGLFERLYLSDLKAKGLLIEKIEIKANEKELLSLAKFVMKDVLGYSFSAEIPTKDYLIHKAIPVPGIFINCGECHLLIRNSAGRVKMGNKRYFAKETAFPIEKIEEKYQKSIEFWLNSGEISSRIEEYVQEGCFYDEEKEIGFMIKDDDFYVFTKVESYSLHEKSNGKMYNFDEALVGSKLKLSKDGINWNHLIVINEYTHPALPETNKELQKICVGKFDYDKIRKNDDIARQIVDLLYNGKKLLTQGYMLSTQPWHTLDEKIFRTNEQR